MTSTVNVVRALRIAIAGAAVAMLCAPTCAMARQSGAEVRQAIVGIWKLTHDVSHGSDGVEKSAFGANPVGQLILTGDGRYSNLNMRADLPKIAAGNRMQGTAEENRAIVHGSIASFGRYAVSDDGKTLTLFPEGCTYAAWIGTEQKRALTLSGDTLRYSLKASMGGVSELTYARVK